MLTYLLDQLNMLVRRHELLRAVWGDNYFMGRSLGKRLANDPDVRTENVHGVGFILRQQSA